MKRYLQSYIEADIANKIVLLTGRRQCGKTTIAKQCRPLLDYSNYGSAENRLTLKEKKWDRKKQLNPLSTRVRSICMGDFVILGFTPHCIITVFLESMMDRIGAKQESCYEIKTYDFNNHGSFDPEQHGLKLDEHDALIGKHSSFSCTIPTPKMVQSYTATTLSHFGTYCNILGLCFVISPGMIASGCDHQNGTEYNRTCHIDSVTRTGVISGFVNVALCVMIFVFASRLTSTVRLDNDKQAPSPEKLKLFVNKIPHLGTFFLAVATALFAAPGIIKMCCNPWNSTDINYNNTGDYDCHLISALEKNGTIGAVLFLLGLFIKGIALVMDRCDNSEGQHVVSELDESDMGPQSEKKFS